MQQRPEGSTNLLAPFYTEDIPSCYQFMAYLLMLPSQSCPITGFGYLAEDLLIFFSFYHYSPLNIHLILLSFWRFSAIFTRTVFNWLPFKCFFQHQQCSELWLTPTAYCW